MSRRERRATWMKREREIAAMATQNTSRNVISGISVTEIVTVEALVRYADVFDVDDGTNDYSIAYFPLNRPYGSAWVLFERGSGEIQVTADSERQLVADANELGIDAEMVTE